MSTEQIAQVIFTAVVIPLSLFFFNRFITKRDKQKALVQIAENEVIGVKLDSISANMREFREDIRKDIVTIHDRISEYKDGNNCAHEKLWTEHNNLRERVTVLETRQER